MYIAAESRYDCPAVTYEGIKEIESVGVGLIMLDTFCGDLQIGQCRRLMDYHGRDIDADRETYTLDTSIFYERTILNGLVWVGVQHISLQAHLFNDLLDKKGFEGAVAKVASIRLGQHLSRLGVFASELIDCGVSQGLTRGLPK